MGSLPDKTESFPTADHSNDKSSVMGQIDSNGHNKDKPFIASGGVVVAPDGKLRGASRCQPATPLVFPGVFRPPEIRSVGSTAVMHKNAIREDSTPRCASDSPDDNPKRFERDSADIAKRSERDNADNTPKRFERDI